MIKSSVASFACALFLAAGASAQTTAPDWGQCGGIGWTGPTTCPSGWSCIVSNPYYSQCLASSTTSTVTPTVPPSSPGTTSPTTVTPPPTTTPVTPTTTTAAPSGTVSLIPGDSFIRTVEQPDFHLYLQSEVLGAASDAVVASPSVAALFQVVNGQLIQEIPGGTNLYAQVEGQENSTVTKLKMSWATTPASGANAGTFVFSGDSLEWTIPTIDRPQANAWLICPDAEGNNDVYINLGNYDYMTPAGCTDETLNAYTGPYATS